jgi:hypothetical protein
MFTEDDFFAISKFLKLGVKISFKNPMGQRPIFTTSFPNPKGGLVQIEATTIYDIERKLRVLLASDIPVKTKLTPFNYLGTNFEGVLYCTKGTNDYVVQETRNLFGSPSNAIIRSAEHFIQLLE